MDFLDWRAFALAAAFFASLTAIFGKIGVSNINSNLATFVRTVVILGVTAFIVTLRKEWRWSEGIDQKSIFFLVLSGIATGASWLCYFRALQLGPVSKVAPIDKLSVAFTVFLAMVFLGETLSLKSIMGVVLIIAGSIVLAI